MCNDIIWPTFDPYRYGNQEYVNHKEPLGSILFGARAYRYLGLKVFAVVFALSLGTLLGAAGPVSATETDTPTDTPRIKLEAAKQTIKALQMELAETRKDRAALQEQLDMASGQIAKQLENIFTSKSWKSDPEVVVLRGKLDAAGKEIEGHVAAVKNFEAEMEALKTRLNAAASKIDTLDKEKVRAHSEVSKLKEDVAAALSQSKQVETERAKLAKSEVAARAAIQELAAAARNSKAEVEKVKIKLQASASTIDTLVKSKNSAVSEISKLKERLKAARREADQSETARIKLAESEMARKAAVQKFVIARAANKTQTKELQSAKTATKAHRKDVQRANEEIMALETKLAKSNALLAEANEMRSSLQRSEQRIESLKAKLGESSNERNVLKTRLDKAQNDIAQRIERVFVAASQKTKIKVSDLRTKLEASNKKLASLQKTASSTSGENKKLTKQIVSLHEELSLLKSGLSKAKTRQKNTEIRLADASKAQQVQLKKLQMANKNTATAATEAKANRKKIDESKQLVKQLKARIEAVEGEKDELQHRYAREQLRATRLDKAVKVSRAERGTLSKQVQAALAKAASVSKEQAQVVQAAESEAQSLREQLAKATRELDDTRPELAKARAQLKRSRHEISKRIDKLIAAAEADPGAQVTDLKERLAAAEEEIAQLRDARGEKSTSSASQQSTQ